MIVSRLYTEIVYDKCPVFQKVSVEACQGTNAPYAPITTGLGRDKDGIKALGFLVVNGASVLQQDYNCVNGSAPIFIDCGTTRGLQE